jgi:hypothetical protein
VNETESMIVAVVRRCRIPSGYARRVPRLRARFVLQFDASRATSAPRRRGRASGTKAEPASQDLSLKPPEAWLALGLHGAAA